MARFKNTIPSTLDQEEFIHRFGFVFENSPWVAQRAWQDGIDQRHDDIDAMHELFVAIVRNAPAQQRQDLINSHPQLSAQVPAGTAHNASRHEQARAGLTTLDDNQRQRFTELNSAYLVKYGFPFILAVSNLHAQTILTEFERRYANGTQESERTTALDEILKIGRLRLERM